ncbi:hypothetical protein LTS18_005938, partial [Coniosporium uncinatum]
MELLLHLVLAAYFVLYVFAWSIPRVYLHVPSAGLQQPLKVASHSDLDTWLKQQEHIATDNLLANIAGGRKAPDAALGSVIASPSKDHPNYYF